jgi:alginate O-acetyltransferase complex protein AlgI
LTLSEGIDAMLFNSYPFLLMFLPIALAGFYLIARWRARAAAAWLVAASLFFYGWWDVRFLALLVPSIVVNYLAGRSLGRFAAAGLDRPKRWLLAGVIAGNLLVLGYFKYVNFFMASANAVFAGHLGPLDVILPLGISFFTFTQIAFLVDASRGEVRRFDFTHYSLFVTWFPHLIAGPILHHGEMMPQFRSSPIYRPSAENFAVGLAYLTFGLAKKCLIADHFAPDAAVAFAAAHQGAAIGALAAWQGALAYTLQLYFDFSGYCDMAVGLSRMFGIRLPFNFNSPYQAVGIIDFWRRWHMTLSRFLRDYLYIPLGGNRRGPARRYLNLAITMLLGGLWHGANWTFVVWGGLHGLYLMINHGWRAARPAGALARVPLALRARVSAALTFAAVLAAWVVFRASDLTSAGHLFAAMAGMQGFDPANGVAMPSPMAGWLDVLGLSPGSARRLDLLRYAAALAVVFALPNTQQIIEGHGIAGDGALAGPLLRIAWRGNFAWGAALGLAGAAALVTFTRVSEFLYFQF